MANLEPNDTLGIEDPWTFVYPTPELAPGTTLDGDERWSFVNVGATDAFTAYINNGNVIPGFSVPTHVDTVEVEDAFPFEKRALGQEKPMQKGVKLGAVAVNGSRVPFTFFVPDAIRVGSPFGPFTGRHIQHIREKAARRQVLVAYESKYDTGIHQ